MPGALDDILILDLSRVLAGPYGTMVLSDFGARVVKVEQPGQGDETRTWGPPFAADGQSAYFLCANRNKESITVNLRSPEGRAIVRALAARADVLIENFKVGTMAALGLGYESLRELNPGLVYCAITGYGQDGPYARRPGYDTVIQAQGGLMSVTGPAEGGPFKVGVAVVDITAGLYAASAILAALHHRARAGEGQLIDIALFDVQLSWLANVASAYLVSGSPPARQGNAHATIVPYQPFAAADGHVMVAVGNDGQFARLCGALGRPEWATDPRFTSNPARVAARDELVPMIAEVMAGRPAAAWVEALLAADVPCAPVNDIPAALADPQAQARGMVREIPAEGGPPVRLVGPAPKLSATPAAVRSAPPRHGQHTEAVLRELLGYDQARIAELRESGAI
ncbi:CoA transferase [Oscillochloris sp. ZM17-4]|uniref:CaiB/BaiF CoA transferase family protein n=1 Tax=Oscillochloris sp. ZM17-4 TaxID=2866714 RepID=UPI001C734B50|nr:CaiB/BaiF CoA-transferase family protein [Oscillochloris sp. ZM17-4]MBX0329501.1 CoA transferase [Oscillochloris sp. ZM17-4]